MSAKKTARKLAKKAATSKLPPGIPERAVDRETLMRFFEPPIGRSTFYKMVNKGVFIKVDGVRGFYRLNESLLQLGLQPVMDLPESPKAAQREQKRKELAMSTAKPDAGPRPEQLQGVGRLTALEKSRVAVMVRRHAHSLFSFTSWPVGQPPPQPASSST